MDGAMVTVAPDELRARYEALRAQEPGVRARDAATRLGVTEAELVAIRCGQDVTRLDCRWGDIVKALPTLGSVMTLTRNDYAVHEKDGRFEKVSVSENGGLVLGQDIDLRLAFGRWRFGYAVREERSGEVRRSLQFFNADGTAVFKVHLRDHSDIAAYEKLVSDHAAGNQSAGEIVEATVVAAGGGTAEGAVDVGELRRRWAALQDVHEFAGLLKDFGINRVQASRLVGPEFAERVTPESFCQALEQVAEADMPVMIFVPSPGVVQIHTGPVKRLRRMGPWFNVLDPGFNLHLRDDGIAEAWVIRKPTSEGIVSSLEIFDARESQIAWLFGQRDRGAPEREEWRRLLDGFARVQAGSA